MLQSNKILFVILAIMTHAILASSQIIYRVTSQDSLFVDKILNKKSDNIDSLIAYQSQAYTFSQNIRYHHGKKQSSLSLMHLYQSKNDQSTALQYGLVALKLIEEDHDKETLLQQNLDIGNIYKSEGLYASAIVYYNRAKNLAMQTSQNEKVVIKIYNLLGYCHAQTTPIDSSIIYYEQNIALYQDSHKAHNILLAYQKIANLYTTFQRYEESLPYNLKILELVEAMRDTTYFAIALNNLAVNYNALGKYDKAIGLFLQLVNLDYLKEALETHELYRHLAIAYYNIKSKKKAIEYFTKAIASLPDGNLSDRANLHYMLALVYLDSSDFYNALEYSNSALDLANNINDFTFLKDLYALKANIHQQLYEYELAFSFYKKHLSLRDSLELKYQLYKKTLVENQIKLEKAEKEIKLGMASRDFQELTIDQLQLEKDKLTLEKSNLSLETLKNRNELALIKNKQELDRTKFKNQELENQRTTQALLISEQELEAERQTNKINALNIIEAEQKLEISKEKALKVKREQEVINLKQARSLNELEIQKQKDFQTFAYILGGLLILISLLIALGFLNSRNLNKKLESKNKIIEDEKDKSDNLLLNILPEQTAKELKESGVARPHVYNEVSVLFTDFVGFTSISSKMSPEELLEELNAYFNKFDSICAEEGLEKIKTIGDAYMCVSGLPVSNIMHAEMAAQAAIKMLSFHRQRLTEKKKEKIDHWDMRLGIHTGKVVAGVVGQSKFAYDIWGDTVNTASRMESSSDPGKINISEVTYNLLNDKFNCDYRGEIEVKNKGRLKMYFLDKENH